MSTKAQFPDETDEQGSFRRQASAFRERVSADPDAKHPVAAGRYHLYVSLACPWAHRTIVVRKLLGLEHALSLSVVDPIRDERGWAFREGPGHGPDPINGFEFLEQAYRATRPDFRGRVTVPVLWDKQLGRIVNNESADILELLVGPFLPLARTPVDFYPEALRAEIDAVAEEIYGSVNNGVYRAGFASTQAAYERAYRELFAALDRLEGRLAERRYLCGAQPTLADWRLFTTLVRFDAVYVTHFKCNERRIIDYPNLWGYVRDLYQIPGVAETVDFDHIKRHYFQTHGQLNPSRIVPLGPKLDFSAPHGRERLGA